LNKSKQQVTLLDLKAILIESKQRIPQFLAQLGNNKEDSALEDRTGVKGCSFCGGFGHRISNCSKAEDKRVKQLKGLGRDYLRH